MTMNVEIHCANCGVTTGGMGMPDDTPPAVVAYRLSGILSRCDPCQAAQDAIDGIVAEPPTNEGDGE